MILTKIIKNNKILIRRKFMDIKHIINKKANRKALTRKEICFFVDGYTNGTITDRHLQKRMITYPFFLLCLILSKNKYIM